MKRFCGCDHLIPIYALIILSAILSCKLFYLCMLKVGLRGPQLVNKKGIKFNNFISVFHVKSRISIKILVLVSPYLASIHVNFSPSSTTISSLFRSTCTIHYFSVKIESIKPLELQICSFELQSVMNLRTPHLVEGEGHSQVVA